METSTQTTILLKALDLELKAQLEKDLAAFRAAQVHQLDEQAA